MKIFVPAVLLRDRDFMFKINIAVQMDAQVTKGVTVDGVLGNWYIVTLKGEGQFTQEDMEGLVALRQYGLKLEGSTMSSGIVPKKVLDWKMKSTLGAIAYKTDPDDDEKQVTRTWEEGCRTFDYGDECVIMWNFRKKESSYRPPTDEELGILIEYFEDYGYMSRQDFLTWKAENEPEVEGKL